MTVPTNRTPKEKACQRLYAVALVSLLAAYIFSHFTGDAYAGAVGLLCMITTMSGLAGLLISTSKPRF